MYQNFDDIGGPAHGAERVGLLRAELERLGLTGFIVPRADEYQNEYVPADAEQLLWLTGFSGSWGVAAVLLDEAALFVDGRYTLQAQSQVDTAAFDIVKVFETPLSQWLKTHLKPGDKIGYDPRRHTVGEIKGLTTAVARVNASLVPVEPNPIVTLWTDRPVLPLHDVVLHPIAFTGVEAKDKIGRIQEKLVSDNRHAVIIAALDSIAWLFNIRGADLPHTPFVLSHAIVPAVGKARLYVDGRKLSKETRAVLADVAEIVEPSALLTDLRGLGREGARVQIDPGSVSQWFANHLIESGAELSEEQDPCLLPKARKNRAEIEGSRAAHHRDGLAMSRFLAWVDANAASGEFTEIDAAEKLESFRRGNPELREISFDTIAGAGPNGAIVHYRPSRSTNRRIETGSLLLMDSGGQYLDGTTDITRTIAIGAPTDEMRRHFTLVLKGHIAIATVRFPKGTRGHHLDALARLALWRAGLDYDHGTGHGVGSFLSVHEGPQSLSRRDAAEIEPGMIISNEPGFYKAGEYGIRIENLVLVTEAEAVEGGERPMMGFETLTLAPIDRRLIALELMTADEIAWLDEYHRRVRRELSEGLDAETRGWLERATAPIER